MAVKGPPAFLGRISERKYLDRLLQTVRGGQSGVLVIRGEAGLGKTALLRHAVSQAAGFKVAQIAGIESEMELPFAGLHQLCAPMLSQIDRLPSPQREALRTAFGLSAGKAPDRFLVGLAALSLLAQIAEERPLLCVVDDGQWLDVASAQILGFVARRLLAESIAIVFAVREPSDEQQLVGLSELRLTGLLDEDAHALLASIVPGPLDAPVADRIVAETGGNPLAILELARWVSSAEPKPDRGSHSCLRRTPQHECGARPVARSFIAKRGTHGPTEGAGSTMRAKADSGVSTPERLVAAIGGDARCSSQIGPVLRLRGG